MSDIKNEIRNDTLSAASITHKLAGTLKIDGVAFVENGLKKLATEDFVGTSLTTEYKGDFISIGRDAGNSQEIYSIAIGTYAGHAW